MKIFFFLLFFVNRFGLRAVIEKSVAAGWSYHIIIDDKRFFIEYYLPQFTIFSIHTFCFGFHEAFGKSS